MEKKKKTQEEFSERLRELGRRALQIILSPYQAFKFICFSIGLIVLLVATGVGFYTYNFVHSLPDLQRYDFAKLKSLTQKRIQAKLDDKKRDHHWTSMQEVNRDFVYTIVMSEDSTFFEHEGIDVDAILNSFAHNIKTKKYEYGASTITQQVAKNLFLVNEKSIIRKIREILITQSLERYFSKNQILELYLNIAEFGPDMFGVNEAAQQYFDKTPSEINAAEGAFIALMLPSPKRNHYAIFQNRNLTKGKARKIRRVLLDMLANEFITPKQYREYMRYNFFTKKNGES